MIQEQPQQKLALKSHFFLHCPEKNKVKKMKCIHLKKNNAMSEKIRNKRENYGTQVNFMQSVFDLTSAYKNFIRKIPDEDDDDDQHV